MPSILIKAFLAVSLALGAFSSYLRGESVSDSNLGFTLELPGEFFPREDLVGVQPDIVHAFQFGEAKEGELAVLLFVEKLGGVIGRERLTKEQLPAGFKGDLFVARWQGFDVDGFEVPETVNGIETITYNVQIPLRRQAVQIKLFGRADRKESLRRLLDQVLAGLKGESNWHASFAPRAAVGSQTFRVVMVCLGIAVVIAGLVGLWFVSQRAPKGVVLVIAAAVYAASWTIDDIRVTEIRLLSGMMRMFGFAGGILGVIDLVRHRKPKPTPAAMQPPPRSWKNLQEMRGAAPTAAEYIEAESVDEPPPTNSGRTP